jgi:hypothetical protein
LGQRDRPLPPVEPHRIRPCADLSPLEARRCEGPRLGARTYEGRPRHALRLPEDVLRDCRTDPPRQPQGDRARRRGPPVPVAGPVLEARDAGEPFDIGWIGYITSQPYDPGAELSSLFDGRTIPKPGTNQDFRDYSYFDSAHYNRLFDKAATLGARVRDRFYGRLDLDIARNAAPMAAYAFDNVFTLVSARTGCVVVNPGIDLTAVCLK